MIARLNLANQPFRNRTLPWTTAVAVTLASLVALALIMTEGARARMQADSAERTVVSMRNEKREIQEKNEAVKQEIPAEQRVVLEAAHALNDRKTFSWSQLFADLEATMPDGVRVQRINVRDVSQREGATRAELELTVVGRSTDDLTGMMSEMNRHGSFQATPVSQQYKKDRGETGYEWMLRVNYMQRARAQGGESAAREGVALAGERAEARE